MNNVREQILELLLDIRKIAKVKNNPCLRNRRKYIWHTDSLQTDEDYLNTLKSYFSICLDNLSFPKETVLHLYKTICNKMYMARNITCNNDLMCECLTDLDMLYNADNDHNGEYSLVDCLIQEVKVQRFLLRKYGIL
jgi:hypothetical protein